MHFYFVLFHYRTLCTFPPIQIQRQNNNNYNHALYLNFYELKFKSKSIININDACTVGDILCIHRASLQTQILGQMD